MSILRFRSDVFSENNAVAPAVAAGGAAGTSPTGKTNAGRDEFGTISITTGATGINGTTLFTVTFAKPYTIAPDVVIVNDNGGLGAYGSATTTTLTVSVKTAPTASTAYKVNYLVVGGA